MLGKGYIHSLTGAAAAITALSGYVSPNMQSLRAGHSADSKMIKSQAGKIAGGIYENDFLECTIEFIPEGSTIANAKLSAGLPAAGSGVTLSGLPVIVCGGIADALNGLWIYEAGGSINGSADGEWTATLPLKRYPLITSATAIT